MQKGASIEARDKKDWTALFHATYSGHQNMVQLLVTHGADINAVYVPTVCSFALLHWMNYLIAIVYTSAPSVL